MRRSLTDRIFYWRNRGDPGEAVTAPPVSTDSPSEEANPLLEALNKILAVTEEYNAQSSNLALPRDIARYEVRSELGQGGMGIVYQAWDPVLRRVVALKMLRPAVPLLLPTESDHRAGRFQQEAQVLAQLKHEAIVPIYEANVDEGQPYFVMECVVGGSMAKHREELTAAGPKEIVALVEKVARAVHYAHSHGVLHRDLKPANILLNEQRQPLVSDFGLAKLLDVPTAVDVTNTTFGTDRAYLEGISTRWTLPGAQPGTPSYMAPEQFDASFGPTSPATDIWALGVILYELLTGQKPFLCRTRKELEQQVCRGQLVRPRAVRPQLDRRLEAVVVRCLAKSPPQRYPTANALADALADWRKRRRLPLLAGAVVALAALTTAVLLFWSRPDDPEQNYHASVTALQTRLQKEGEVELVPSNPEQSLAFILRSGQAGTVVKHIQGGLSVHAPSHCCLIELLPEVPARSYRIRARLRREKPLLTDVAQWGVYCQHSTVVTALGTQHYFNAAYCSGSDEWKMNPPPPVYTISASLLPRLFGDALDRPFREFYAIDTAGTFHQDVKYPPRPDTPWSLIEVTVVGDLITAKCRVDGGEPVADKLRITLKDQNETKDAVLKMFPDFAGVAREQFAGTALGIYIREAVCTIESFVVETINNP